MTTAEIDSRGPAWSRRAPTPALLWLTAFLVGLIGFDQTLNAVGTYLVRGKYTPDVMLNSLISQQHDIVIVGGCRAALHLDSTILSEITGKRVFNAGRVVDGVGFIDLLAHLAIPRTKQLIIVMDINNWQETREADSADIQKYRVWLTALEPSYRTSFALRYSLPLPWLDSGFLNFYGKGPDLIRAMRSYLVGRQTPIKDGYDFRKPNLIPDPSLNDPEFSAKYTIKAFRPDAFPVSTVEGIIEDAKSQGLEPILMLSPMHHVYASEPANEMQVALVGDLVAKYKIRLLNYVGNYTDFGKNDVWWTDSGHMNVNGAERLSRLVAEELRGFDKTP